MKRTGPTNIHLRRLVHKLRKYSRQYNAPIWRDVAEKLWKPRRQRIVVNLSTINRFTEEGDTVIVPGKVLGSGELDHGVVVAAWRFSRKALKEIKKRGEALTIDDLLEKNPQGKGVKIIA